MDSRKILEIYKRINDRRLKPVSEFPSVSDIPPGMLVLDADGVVKKNVYCFNNEGTDWVDCGRPSWIDRLIPKTNSFTIVAVCRQSVGGFQSIVGLSDTDPPVSPSKTQFMLGLKTGGAFEAYVGGSALGGTLGLVPVGSINQLSVSVNLTRMSVYKNGVFDVSASISTKLSDGNLFIGAIANGFNFEGFIAYVAIYAGANEDGSVSNLELLDKYDFNKWDGTSVGLSDKGFAYSVTDNAPLSARKAFLVPAFML